MSSESTPGGRKGLRTHGQFGRTGSPKAVRTLSIPSVASRTWLGAGKTHDRQPTTLYAASQVARSRTQIVSRRRLPEIVCHLRLAGGRGACVDTVDLVL